MTRRRLAAGGAVLVLWLAAGIAWAVLGAPGLLAVLTALVAALLVVGGVVFLRTDELSRGVRSLARETASTARAAKSTGRELEIIRASLGDVAERQLSESTIEQAVESAVERVHAQLGETVQGALDGGYAQIEELLNLHSTLRPRQPLPPLRGWAVSPDFMSRAITIVLNERPGTIVECGSGTSTVYLGLALRQAGGGRIVSLEHKERFAEATRGMLVDHGLDDVVTVRHAPLRTVTVDGAEWLWYDPAALAGIDDCGLLVVDGPPRTVAEMARYPALPMLRDRLRPGAAILMDDYRRKTERRTVRRWMAEHPKLQLRIHEHEKQTAELRFPGL